MYFFRIRSMGEGVYAEFCFVLGGLEMKIMFSSRNFFKFKSPGSDPENL